MPENPLKILKEIPPRGWVYLALLIAACWFIGYQTENIWYGISIFALMGFVAGGMAWDVRKAYRVASLPPACSSIDRAKAEQIAVELLATSDFARWDRYRRIMPEVQQIIVERIGVINQRTRIDLAHYVRKRLDACLLIRRVEKYSTIIFLSFITLSFLLPFIEYILGVGVAYVRLTYWILTGPILIIGPIAITSVLLLGLRAPKLSLAVLSAQRDPVYVQILLDSRSRHMMPLASRAVYDALGDVLTSTEEITDVLNVEQLQQLLSKIPMYSAPASDKLSVLLIQRMSTILDPVIIEQIHGLRRKWNFRFYPDAVKKAVIVALESYRPQAA